jgi:uncharacterized protein YqjF (DUF2071 family)
MSESRRAFLTAQWRHLVMLNFEIDPKQLTKYVPCGTELDFWNGRTYVSLVGFRFLDTKVLGLPIPFHRHFTEVNLRLYVRRKAGDGWRRGVVFIKEIVPLYAVTAVARWVYNENYITLPMQHQIDIPGQSNATPSSIAYGWRWQGRWMKLATEVVGESQPLVSDSEEQFITEHYWGYTKQRDGGTMEYGVEHPSWRVWSVMKSRFECDVASLYGPDFVEVLQSRPTSAFVADGSEIIVRAGSKIRV